MTGNMAITPESRELAVIPREFAQDLTRSSSFPDVFFRRSSRRQSRVTT